ADPALRADILAAAEARGWPDLHRELAEVDPETAADLHPHHSQRIQRALEIHRLTGKPASQLKREQASAPDALAPLTCNYHIVQIALLPRDRALLHRRIAE